jgi:hypothetical protein
MPNYEALAGMMQGRGPSGELHALRSKRKSELEVRAAMGTDRQAPALLRLLQGEMNEDPDTGLDAQKDVAQIENAQQAGKVYNLDETKQVRDETNATALERLMKPIEAKGQLDNERQRIASKGLMNVAQIATQGKRGGGGGGRLGAGAPLASGLMERVAGGDNAIASLRRLREQRDGVTIGPIAGRVQSLGQKIPLIPGTKEFASFKAESDGLVNMTIKAVTGAQMTESEAVRIKGQIPTENDKDEVWNAKSEVLERMTLGLNVRIGLLAKGVPAELLNQYPVEELPNHLQEFGEQGAPEEEEMEDLGPEWGNR